jgi:putative ABC transport system ATP-binding protein
MPILEAKKISKSYDTVSENQIVLNELNLSVDAGEMVMILGPSGSGKSTLLNILNGIDLPDQGEMYFNGKRFDNLKDNERTRMRLNDFTTVLQGFELIKVMNCYDNIAYPLKLCGLKKAEIEARIQNVAGELEITHLLTRKPEQISVGQKQRIAIARALVTKTQLFLGDEITANLDKKLTHKVIKYLKDKSEKQQTAFIIVTHDLQLVPYATKALTLADGKLESLN